MRANHYHRVVNSCSSSHGQCVSTPSTASKDHMSMFWTAREIAGKPVTPGMIDQTATSTRSKCCRQPNLQLPAQEVKNMHFDDRPSRKRIPRSRVLPCGGRAAPNLALAHLISRWPRPRARLLKGLRALQKQLPPHNTFVRLCSTALQHPPRHLTLPLTCSTTSLCCAVPPLRIHNYVECLLARFQSDPARQLHPTTDVPFSHFAWTSLSTVRQTDTLSLCETPSTDITHLHQSLTLSQAMILRR